MVYSKERFVTNTDDCWFYHVMDLPELGTVGHEWDLRGRVNDYLGNTELRGKRVLDVGTASGFLTFEMERMGAEVVSLDADGPKCWFLLPFKDQLFTTKRDEWEASCETFIARMNNGYWLAHRLNKSKAKMVYANVYSIPPELGQFDIAVVGQVLVHLSDPVRALSSVIDRVHGRIVVTEGMVDSDEPIMSLCSRAATGVAWSWWHLSIGLYREIFTMAGFEIENITHGQFCCVNPNFPSEQRLTTIVARRI
jgi:SAM-dependent methyltransferase